MNKEEQLRNFTDRLIRFAPNSRNITAASTVDDLLRLMKNEAAALYHALCIAHDADRAQQAAEKITGVLISMAVIGVFTEAEAVGLQNELQTIMEKF